MREGTNAVRDAVEQLRVESLWAFPVNETAERDDLEITLLTCTIVDDLVRITGLFRFRSFLDIRLASIPRLTVATRDGVRLNPVSSHVLPHGRIAWVSWLFDRPARVLAEYEARIDTVSLGQETGRRPPEEHSGPWEFRFELPPAPPSASMLAALDD